MKKLVGVVKEYSLCSISVISFVVFLGEIFRWLLYV